MTAPFALDIPAPAPVRPILNGALERLLGLSRLNDVYSTLPRGAAPEAWIDAALAALGVGFEVDAGDAARIPKDGAVVVVANHPFGAIEGLVLLRMLRAARPDVRIVANRLLTRIPELRDVILDVDVFGGAAAAGSNRTALRRAIRWLRGGGALAVFPAGEVSHVRFGSGVVDPPWSEDVAAFARRGGAHVLPVHFPGSNGPLFQAAGLVHPRLRTALLPRELLNKARATIRVRVGEAVNVARLAAEPDDAAATGYLRMRTDLLARRGEVRAHRSVRAEPVAEPGDPALYARELESLPPGRTLATNGSLSVLVASGTEIPAALREIGRRREVAFRQVGEGTGRELDLDRFDAHYRHLVLWDREARAVAGAYRIARTDEAREGRGVAGLYTSTLFRIVPEFFERLGPAFELGRSFVAPEYQRSFSPLMLLWKGIGACVLREPDSPTLVGPVSISGRYPQFARRLMVEWLRTRAGAEGLAPLARPRRPLQRSWRDDAQVRDAAARLRDMDDLSDAVADVAPALRGVPVLVREYHRLGGRFASFSVDPAFGGVVDALVVIDLRRTERRTLSRYMGRDGAGDFLARHGR